MGSVDHWSFVGDAVVAAALFLGLSGLAYAVQFRPLRIPGYVLLMGFGTVGGAVGPESLFPVVFGAYLLSLGTVGVAAVRVVRKRIRDEYVAGWRRGMAGALGVTGALSTVFAVVALFRNPDGRCPSHRKFCAGVFGTGRLVRRRTHRRDGRDRNVAACRARDTTSPPRGIRRAPVVRVLVGDAVATRAEPPTTESVPTRACRSRRWICARGTIVPQHRVEGTDASAPSMAEFEDDAVTSRTGFLAGLFAAYRRPGLDQRTRRRHDVTSYVAADRFVEIGRPSRRRSRWS